MKGLGHCCAAVAVSQSLSIQRRMPTSWVRKIAQVLQLSLKTDLIGHKPLNVPLVTCQYCRVILGTKGHQPLPIVLDGKQTVWGAPNPP